MHKNNAPGVAHTPFNSMGKMLQKNKDFVVWFVIALIYGEYLLTRIYIISTGLSYGLRRVALLGYSVSYPVIVNSSLTALKITGSITLPKHSQTTPGSSMRSMMQLTFTRMGV